MGRKPTMEITVASFFWMLVVFIATSLTMYGIGVWTGLRIHKPLPPTAHVEVTSREMEGKR